MVHGRQGDRIPHTPLQCRLMSRPAAVTGLLRAWSEGDPTALDALIPLVEAELHRLARAYMARERRDHTLQATALVNETFLRLTGAEIGRAHV